MDQIQRIPKHALIRFRFPSLFSMLCKSQRKVSFLEYARLLAYNRGSTCPTFLCRLGRRDFACSWLRRRSCDELRFRWLASTLLVAEPSISRVAFSSGSVCEEWPRE